MKFFEVFSITFLKLSSGVNLYPHSSDKHAPIEKINSSDSIVSSNQFETTNLKEGFIYRNNINGFRFWTQILKMNEKPFESNNFYDYYNKICNNVNRSI